MASLVLTPQKKVPGGTWAADILVDSLPQGGLLGTSAGCPAELGREVCPRTAARVPGRSAAALGPASEAPHGLSVLWPTPWLAVLPTTSCLPCPSLAAASALGVCLLFFFLSTLRNPLARGPWCSPVELPFEWEIYPPR